MTRFALPLPGGRLCSTASIFGAPRDGGARRHEGIDLCAGYSRQVVAPAAGKVTRAGAGTSSCGINVVIDHGSGWTSSQCHLAGVETAVGDVVRMGDVIGIEGATGNASGVHLHTSLRIGGVAVDPLPLYLWPVGRGELVRKAQQRLEVWGFDPQGVDGIMGKNTAAALADFQAHRWPWLEVSRVLDAQTLRALWQRPRTS